MTRNVCDQWSVDVEVKKVHVMQNAEHGRTLTFSRWNVYICPFFVEGCILEISKKWIIVLINICFVFFIILLWFVVAYLLSYSIIVCFAKALACISIHKNTHTQLKTPHSLFLEIWNTKFKAVFKFKMLHEMVGYTH